MADKSYRQLEDELDEILSRVESAKYENLDDLLKDYQLGINHIEILEERLKTAKNTLKKVSK